MKRFLSVVVLFCFLAGCSDQQGVEPAMELRQKLLSAETCTFVTTVTAQYDEQVYTFTMDCSVGFDGELTFQVVKPDTIAGISGVIGAEGGHLTFDEEVLTFPLMADGLVSPVSAPWLLLRTLRSGYISAGGQDGDLYKVMMDDSYESNPLRMDVWLDQNHLPVSADLIWEGKRFLSLSVEKFSLQ